MNNFDLNYVNGKLFRKRKVVPRGSGFAPCGCDAQCVVGCSASYTESILKNPIWKSPSGRSCAAVLINEPKWNPNVEK